MWIPGHDQAVASWAQRQFDNEFNFWAMHSAFGVAAKDGTLIGAAIFSDYYRGGNVELTYVGPGTLTRTILNQIAFHAFVTLGCSRLTCRTRRSNLSTIRLLKKIGFQWEGNQKRYYGPRDEDTAVLFAFPVEQATKFMRLN